MENSNQQKDTKIETNLGMEDIEIKYIRKFLIRNLKLILTIVSSSFLLSIFYSYQQKEIWGGEFQIVIDENNNSSSSMPNLSGGRSAASLLRFGNVSSKLSTEVEILKSPSVLMSVFEFVKDEKKNQDISFKNWRKDLTIKLEKGTSVLNIKYKDEDKTLILPVLNKITQKYQSYTGNKRRSEIKRGIDYLNNQINLFSSKSKNSMEAAQLYSIKNEMPFPQTVQDNGNNNDESQSIPNFMNGGINESNELKLINNQLEKISKIDDPLEIYSFANLNGGMQTENFIESIAKLERYQQIFTSNSKYIRDLSLEIERKSLLLKNSIINDLKTKQYLLKKRKKINQRPIEVVLKYQDLWQKATRISRIQADLEGQLIALKLDQARDKKPWDLITKPTLLENRIFPNRSQIVLRWFFSSLLIAFITSYFIENSEKKIYKISDLQKLIPFNFIEKLSINDQNSWEEYIDLFAKSNLILSDSKKILLITLGENTKSFGISLCESLNNIFKEKTFYTTDKLDKFSETDQQFLLCETEGIKREKIDQFLRRLKFLDVNIAGWFAIET